MGSELTRWSIYEVKGHPVVDVDVTIHCSKGTYIRSLARDLGDASVWVAR